MQYYRYEIISFLFYLHKMGHYVNTVVESRPDH